MLGWLYNWWYGIEIPEQNYTERYDKIIDNFKKKKAIDNYNKCMKDPKDNPPKKINKIEPPEKINKIEPVESTDSEDDTLIFKIDDVKTDVKPDYTSVASFNKSIKKD